MMPLSSVRKPYVGRALRSSPIRVWSARRSAALTKSPGPLERDLQVLDLGRSRASKPRPALRTACTITFIRAVRAMAELSLQAVD